MFLTTTTTTTTTATTTTSTSTAAAAAMQQFNFFPEQQPFVGFHHRRTLRSSYICPSF